MLGINYASSDEDDEESATKPELVNQSTAPARASASASAAVQAVSSSSIPAEETHTNKTPQDGPSQGPAPAATPPPPESGSATAPGSPYTSTRAMIQNLTLPTVPNFAIPPSPPGSPPQRATKKFAQFLELKKKGQHFNQRLEISSVLRDPGHLQKLMGFAGISEEDSLTSTLSSEGSIPPVFPEWAYVEELRASQKRLSKAKEQERSKKPRDAVDFVSATKSGASSRPGMSGAAASSKRKELEHRSRDQNSSGANSPKRRR